MVHYYIWPWHTWIYSCEKVEFIFLPLESGVALSVPLTNATWTKKHYKTPKPRPLRGNYHYPLLETLYYGKSAQAIFPKDNATWRREAQAPRYGPDKWVRPSGTSQPCWPAWKHMSDPTLSRINAQLAHFLMPAQRFINKWLLFYIWGGSLLWPSWFWIFLSVIFSQSF